MTTLIPAKLQSKLNERRYADQRVPPQPGSVCRLLPDEQCAIKRGNGAYPFLWRFYGNKKGIAYWSTVVLRGDTGNVILAKWWQEYFYRNNSARAIAYNAGHGSRPQVGWVNSKPWPTVKQITTTGDALHEVFVVVDEIKGKRAYIQSYDNAKIPADYDTDYLHVVGVTYPDGSVGAPPCGMLKIFPIANRGKRLYVDVQDVSFVRAL